MKKIKCVCGTKTIVNTDKHRFREKYCRNNLCKRPIDNLYPKVRVNLAKLRLDEERRRQTRERFVARMRRLRIPMQKIAKMLVDPFPWEERNKKYLVTGSDGKPENEQHGSR